MADTNSPNSPKRSLSADRRMNALEMRKSGSTYEKIGDALGISSQAAYQHVVKALQAIREKTNEAADEVRTLEITRIDTMIGVLWPRVLKGDYLAMDRVIKLMERRSKMLGLDAPTKSDITSDGIVTINFVDIVNGSEAD